VVKQSKKYIIKELFERIYIKSEADLPKEEQKEIYWHAKNSPIHDGLRRIWYSPEEDSKSWFIERFDWYLQPVIQEEPTKERISMAELQVSIFKELQRLQYGSSPSEIAEATDAIMRKIESSELSSLTPSRKMLRTSNTKTYKREKI
jgi:hypothetical protein